MLDFEKQIVEMESRVRDLRATGHSATLNLTDEIARIDTKITRLLKTTYGRLTPQQRVQVARAEGRPHFSDYVARLVTNYTPLSGDRLYGDDQALLGGLGHFRGQSVVIMGHEKGHDLNSRLKHNFGMSRPEGYRKAQRLMHMAEQFKLPVITLVDTAGAYPGVDAEERGQAEAIAKSIETCLNLRTPIISVIVGEGGSGGAIAIATADRVYMMEHSVYSVISPEGCASILWRSASFAGDAAAALKLTAPDMLRLKLIDAIIEEPLGGAHRHREQAIDRVGDKIEQSIKDLASKSEMQLKDERRKKFIAMGRDLPSHDDKHWFF